MISVFSFSWIVIIGQGGIIFGVYNYINDYKKSKQY